MATFWAFTDFGVITGSVVSGQIAAASGFGTVFVVSAVIPLIGVAGLVMWRQLLGSRLGFGPKRSPVGRRRRLSSHVYSQRVGTGSRPHDSPALDRARTRCRRRAPRRWSHWNLARWSGMASTMSR